MISQDLHVGDFIQINSPDCGGPRRMEVVEQGILGFRVKWFTPEGLGPYYTMLPHGELPGNTLHQKLYADESAGTHESYWKVHKDFTGKTGEF